MAYFSLTPVISNFTSSSLPEPHYLLDVPRKWRLDFPLKGICGYYSPFLRCSCPQIHGSFTNSIPPGLYSIVTCSLFSENCRPPPPATYFIYIFLPCFIFFLRNDHFLTHYITYLYHLLSVSSYENISATMTVLLVLVHCYISTTEKKALHIVNAE